MLETGSIHSPIQRVPSGATGDRAADRARDTAATRVQGVHGRDGTGDRHPYSTARAGTGGLRPKLKWGSKAHGQSVWLGVSGEAG